MIFDRPVIIIYFQLLLVGRRAHSGRREVTVVCTLSADDAKLISLDVPPRLCNLVSPSPPKLHFRFRMFLELRNLQNLQTRKNEKNGNLETWKLILGNFARVHAMETFGNLGN